MHKFITRSAYEAFPTTPIFWIDASLSLSSGCRHLSTSTSELFSSRDFCIYEITLVKNDLIPKIALPLLSTMLQLIDSLYGSYTNFKILIFQLMIHILAYLKQFTHSFALDYTLIQESKHYLFQQL